MKECNCASRHKISAVSDKESVIINGKRQLKVTTYHQCNKCSAIWYTTDLK